MKARRMFDTQFKLDVVHLVKDQDLSVSEVVKTMGLGETAIRRWVAQYDAELEGRSGIGKGTLDGLRRSLIT